MGNGALAFIATAVHAQLGGSGEEQSIRRVSGIRNPPKQRQEISLEGNC
jgi:hypothetical protein